MKTSSQRFNRPLLLVTGLLVTLVFVKLTLLRQVPSRSSIQSGNLAYQRQLLSLDPRTVEQKPNAGSPGLEEVRNQVSHWTSFDRYPDEYKAVVSKLSDKKTPKLLSFGSSTGREAVTLAKKYFPQGSIYGVDIDDQTLAKAKAYAKTELENDEAVTFFNGLHTPIQTYGPYDAIFANSVLCQNPVNEEGCIVKGSPRYTKVKCSVSRFQDFYSFETFESTVERLDKSLVVGGVLAIVNSNYEFTDTEISNRYEPLEEICGGNFIPRVNQESQTIERIMDRVCGYKKVA